MLQRQMQHLFLYIPIFCTVGLFGFGGINMDNKYLNEVLERLESYRKKEQQIELLRYELQHAKQVSPTELIEAMTFQTRDADGSQTDLYPKDVPGIALSYQHIAAQLNEEAVGELISRYTALCHERDRLLHYIGLLDKRQQDVVRKHYFEQQSWSEIASSMDLTPRTVQRTRQQALDELANLYAFADGILRR